MELLFFGRVGNGLTLIYHRDAKGTEERHKGFLRVTDDIVDGIRKHNFLVMLTDKVNGCRYTAIGR